MTQPMSMPRVGSAAFALTCNNAAPNTAGLIGFAGAGLPSLATLLGVHGLRLFAQSVWLGPNAPSPYPPSGLSASNALDFTIQP